MLPGMTRPFRDLNFGVQERDRYITITKPIKAVIAIPHINSLPRLCGFLLKFFWFRKVWEVGFEPPGALVISPAHPFFHAFRKIERTS